MAYFNNLTEKKQTEILTLLNSKIRQESETMYQTALPRAKTDDQACAGRWYELREQWQNGEVNNLHVYACLQMDFVP
ncbi:hypothetical protein VTH8203_01534 [Vibrio thalassae]|uniref:Uncharacterized protein n=1 Tax=Vibrio thalassae TaxID=1243014 RepID=A0A240EIB9_9VIBR|nr:hypothetical protein [Vibrio thalassae]SNX47919.1 hypothetical protein VTH8203_01534 [Vibrio thalassae]